MSRSAPAAITRTASCLVELKTLKRTIKYFFEDRAKDRRSKLPKKMSDIPLSIFDLAIAQESTPN